MYAGTVNTRGGLGLGRRGTRDAGMTCMYASRTADEIAVFRVTAHVS